MSHDVKCQKHCAHTQLLMLLVMMLQDLGDPMAEGPNNPTPRQVMDKMLQKLAGDLADAEYTLD